MFEELSTEEVIQFEKEVIQSQMFEDELTIDEREYLLYYMYNIKQV